MKAENGRCSEMRIAYIGGGSRGWAWKLMADLAMENTLSGNMVLYDIDKQAAENNRIIGNRLSAREESVGKWQYETADTLKDALTGADFVIISILPGTFDEMEVDVHMPERLNVWQSVGDTAGPGGMMRALRTIPMFVEFAEAIRDYAPQAWVINYTNPMSLCVKTLYHVFPKIKAFGCCHEVFGTQSLLRNLCTERLGLENVTRPEVHVNVVGINHFTWFSEASCRGYDLFPVFAQYAEEKLRLRAEKKDTEWLTGDDGNVFKNQVKSDLFRRFGWIAAAGDRHLAEFMPGNEYLDSPETVLSWGFKLTTVKSRKDGLARRLIRSRELVEGADVELKASGEEGVRLIRALCGLERMVSNVNIPNTAKQISNLPEDAVVETNAVFCKDSLRPVYAGEAREDVKALLMPHIDNHNRILYAAVNCDRDAALEAMMHDPQLIPKCSRAQMVQLLEDMLQGTKAYLPAGWRLG